MTTGLEETSKILAVPRANQYPKFIPSPVELLMQTFTFLQLQFKTSASDLRCHQKAALFRTLVGWCCCSGSSCLLADKQLDPSGHCHHIEFSSVFGGKPILKIKVVLLEKYLSLFILLSFKSKTSGYAICKR